MTAPIIGIEEIKSTAATDTSLDELLCTAIQMVTSVTSQAAAIATAAGRIVGI
jgi:hypothetical protein